MIKQVNEVPSADNTATSTGEYVENVAADPGRPDSYRKTALGSGEFKEPGEPFRQGNLIVLTGPSGVGKGTLTERMLKDIPQLVKSVSVTTRAKRPQEVDGKDYFFKSTEEFERMVHAYEFLEHAEFAGNYYGTPKSWVDNELKQGNDVLLEIEVQGAKQVRLKRPQSLLIFVSPPSFEALRQRLEGRATETEEKIKARLQKAQEELNEKHLFHYEVVNDDIDIAVNNLVHIVYAERRRIRR
ncbi:MAG: guanylate kinase [Candidatus Obscuribacterales bacterium]|nr:guanylate kinase [Candidatus Obscuribacterales bacterium]